MDDEPSEPRRRYRQHLEFLREQVVLTRSERVLHHAAIEDAFRRGQARPDADFWAKAEPSKPGEVRSDWPALRFLLGIGLPGEGRDLPHALGLPAPLTFVPADGEWSEEWIVRWPDGTAVARSLSSVDEFLALADRLLSAWIAHLDGGGSAPATRLLVDRPARWVLELLLRREAFDELRACDLGLVAPRAHPHTGAPSAESAGRHAAAGLAALKGLGLVAAAPRTGAWLTPAGRAEAERLHLRPLVP